jgi:glycosyltransferase involved in cell wall biosynthesis
MLGFRDDVPHILAASDIVVAPTRYEAYGLGVHEALCRGIPALVTETAGVAEQYPTRLGQFLLRPSVTPADLAQSLRAWRATREDCRESVAELSNRLRMRTWSHMAADVVTLTREAFALARASSDRTHREFTTT